MNVDESMRFSWSRLCTSLRSRHGHNNSRPHVKATRSSRVCLYSTCKVINKDIKRYSQ